MKKLIILLLMFLTACSQQPTERSTDEIDVADVAQKCVELCKQQTIDLSNGPCLSNEIISDWVCDVAHLPRQSVDDLPENQCQDFREGKAKHFVEVTPNCKLIRKY